MSAQVGSTRSKKAIQTGKGTKIALKDIKDRYNRFILDWTEATGGEFTGESADLKTIMDDIFYIVYGCFPSDFSLPADREKIQPVAMDPEQVKNSDPEKFWEEWQKFWRDKKAV